MDRDAIAAEQAQLRSSQQNLLRAKSVGERAESSKNLLQNLTTFIRQHPEIQRLGVYSPLKDEPQIQDLKTKLESPIPQLCFPRMIRDQLTYFEAQTLTKSGYGIAEPDLSCLHTREMRPQAVLVPGVVFHKSGIRIGRGKGFYDRYLAAFEGMKIGICFQHQLVEKAWQVQAHDQKVQWIVTDRGLITCTG